MINKFNIFRKYIKKWQKHRQLSCFFNLFGKFPILGCHLLDGCLLAPV